MMIFTDGDWGLEKEVNGHYIWIAHNGCGWYKQTIYTASNSPHCWNCKSPAPDSLMKTLFKEDNWIIHECLGFDGNSFPILQHLHERRLDIVRLHPEDAVNPCDRCGKIPPPTTQTIFVLLCNNYTNS